MYVSVVVQSVGYYYCMSVPVTRGFSKEQLVSIHQTLISYEYIMFGYYYYCISANVTD